MGLKWTDIDFKEGKILKWGNVSEHAFAFVRGAKEYEIEGSEYIFPDRWGMIIDMEKFAEIKERIDEEAGMTDLLKPSSDIVQ